MFKSIIVVACAFVSTQSQAADLSSSVKKVDLSLEQTRAIWNGAYVGISGGYAWDAKTTRIISPHGTSPWTGNGIWQGYDNHNTAFGGQVGYLVQSGSIVGGVQVEVSSAGHARWDQHNFLGPGDISSTDIRGEGHAGLYGGVTGRLGLALDKTLIYVSTGLVIASAIRGAAGYKISGDRWTASPVVRSVSGYSLGFGIEQMIDTNWSAALEYRYHALGQKSFTATSVSYPTEYYTFNRNYNGSVIKASVNYRFGN